MEQGKDNSSKYNKYIHNTIIQKEELYGKVKPENMAKNYITSEILNSFYIPSISTTNITYIDLEKKNKVIPGEESLGIEKLNFGGIIIINKKIGENFCNEYNTLQQLHLQHKTFAHKSLCERREEPMGLIFLTLHDFIGNIDYKELDLDNKSLCNYIRDNIKEIIELDMPWVIKYSKHILRNYYNVPSAKLQIKLNFLFDDGRYDQTMYQDNKICGGLLLNGFLKELAYYSMFSPTNDIGVICQVLAPNGLPINKKWIQIDVGISFTGKRLYKENLKTAFIRQLKTIHAKVSNSVLNEAIRNEKLYYGSLPNGVGYDGYCIAILEIFYNDQINMIEETPLSKKFCKCKERKQSIIENNEQNYKLLKKEVNKNKIYSVNNFI